MILDALLIFTGADDGIGNSDGRNDAPTTGTQPSSNVIDLGLVDGVPSAANGGGARDLGAGYPLRMLAQVAEDFEGGTSLQVAVEGAPDDGTGAPDTYTTMAFGPVVVEADLVVGSRLLEIDLPRPATDQPLPRFLRLSFISDGTHTDGLVTGTMVLDRFDQVGSQGPVLGGYPAGINVAN